MGLRDRILDYIAKAFMPAVDHPARGGMTGNPGDAEEESGVAGDSDVDEGPGAGGEGDADPDRDDA